MNSLDQLALFLDHAPALLQSADHPLLLRLHLPLPHYNEPIACVVAEDGQLLISGTDILRILLFRLRAVARPFASMKKFEEGVFSDLRNLKPGESARLEQARSPLLEALYRFGCIRTQKRQKVFYWSAVDHDRLFRDSWEREMRRERDAVDTYKTVNPNAPLDSPLAPLVEMDDATAETAAASKLEDPLLITYIRSLEDPVERPWNVLPEARDWFTQELSTKSSRCVGAGVASNTPPIVPATAATPQASLIAAPLALSNPSPVTSTAHNDFFDRPLPSLSVNTTGMFPELPRAFDLPLMSASSFLSDDTSQSGPAYLPPILPSWMLPEAAAVENPAAVYLPSMAYDTPENTTIASSSFGRTDLMAELESFLTPPVENIGRGTTVASSVQSPSCKQEFDPLFIVDPPDLAWVNAFERDFADYYQPRPQSPTRSNTPWPVPSGRKHERALDLDQQTSPSTKRPRVTYI